MTNDNEDIDDIELGDDDERPFPDSDEAIRALQDVAESVDELLDEAQRLRDENKLLRAEREEAERTILRLESQYGVAIKDRDEARKMCCELEARIIVLEEDRRDTSNKFGTNPCSEIILADSPLARYPKEIAKRKGWDCFKEDCK